ncbi:transcriptional regulator [Agrobacterium rubi]|uniref:HVO_A0114 family putative DNA-binding protein n=1 Tax=Agrobacterium rubi TaxID=28099 RepID=UPI001572BE18|nr:transcriptional regulator [Agrobacterium rubi]NTF08372.1 transcriptional regulator [Agrobacterium rubi]NTF20600.1 transcriptional regulator [Agrobacterium rubi]NTF27570.1 transcriptional regulator [Agrobacterium rubi]
MKRAVIQIRQDEDELSAIAAMGERFASTWKSGEPQNPASVLSFSSPAQLFTVITPKRWALIEHLQTIGPSTIRGLSRSLERDVKRVHDDVQALMDWGIIDKDEHSKVFVPFDEIEADFVLKASAAA